MPTNKEVIQAEGNHALANAIQKHGGYEYWANKLGLEQKYSDTKLGIQGERRVAAILELLGLKVELTSIKHPYDLLVNDCIKIDVKTANTTYIQGYPIHAYRLGEKKQQTCDFYIFFEIDTGKVYVVPAHKCAKQIMVEMGDVSLSYRKYLGAYHLITEASNMYQRM